MNEGTREGTREGTVMILDGVVGVNTRTVTGVSGGSCKENELFLRHAERHRPTHYRRVDQAVLPEIAIVGRHSLDRVKDIKKTFIFPPEP